MTMLNPSTERALAGQTRARSRSFVRAAQVLARMQWLAQRNTWWRGTSRRIALAALIAGLSGLGAGAYWLMRTIVRLLQSPELERALHAGQADPSSAIPTSVDHYLTGLPSVVLLGLLALLVVGSFSSVLSALFLCGDLDLFVVAPVPMRAVFVAKFFESLTTPYVLLLALLAPALAGYGQGMGYGAAYFLAIIPMLLLFPLAPVGLAALLVMAVVRVIPARRARDIVAALGGLIGVGWFIVNQLADEITARVATVQTLAWLQGLDHPLLPSTWAARALTEAGQSNWPALTLYGGLFLGLSLAVFGGCLVLAERWYYAGWANLAARGGRVRRRQQSAATSGIASMLVRPLPRASRAIAVKDLRIFPRDLRYLQALLFPLTIAAFWIFRAVTGSGTSPSTSPEMERLLATGLSTSISFFLCMSLGAALNGAGINREGSSAWRLRVAPISCRKILLGKFFVAYLPYVVVGPLCLAALAIVERRTLAGFMEGLGLLLLSGIGTTAISIGMSAAFPHLDASDPRRQASVQATLLSLAGYILYVALALIAVFGMPAFGRYLPHLTLHLHVAGWLLLVAVTALTALGSLAFGARRLERLEL